MIERTERNFRPGFYAKRVAGCWETGMVIDGAPSILTIMSCSRATFGVVAAHSVKAAYHFSKRKVNV